MRRQLGFTLLEILAVVALVATIMGLAVYTLNAGLPGAQLRGAARELAAELRFARAVAIASGQSQVFTLDARTREWRGPQRHAGTLPRSIEVVATGARIEQAEPDEVSVRFFPEGAATGGRFVLHHDGAAWRVDVEWLTGQVTLQRADAP